MFDKDIAISTFVERYTQNKGKRHDNSSDYAGAPMVYHCRHCSEHTQTLPESHSQRPITICAPCTVLEDHGLIPEAKKAYEATRKWQKT